MLRLDGRVALITGGAGGIGQQTAIRLAAEGATVVVTDIADEAGAAVAATIRADGGQASYLHLDVTDEAGWASVVDATVREFGGLDILVNNAGISDGGTIDDTSLETYERTIAVTQTSVLLGMRACAAALRASEHASVINISSIFGASGGYGTSPAYHAAKGAVRLLTKNAALRWVEDGIRVNSVHPGFIDTPILDRARGTGLEDAIYAMTPMRRLGRPAEVAAAVAYLASDDASFSTGSELYVDGGYMAR